MAAFRGCGSIDLTAVQCNGQSALGAGISLPTLANFSTEGPFSIGGSGTGFPIRRSRPTRVSCFVDCTGWCRFVAAMKVRANSVASSLLGTTYLPLLMANLSSLSRAVRASLTFDVRGNFVLDFWCPARAAGLRARAARS